MDKEKINQKDNLDSIIDKTELKKKNNPAIIVSISIIAIVLFFVLGYFFLKAMTFKKELNPQDYKTTKQQISDNLKDTNKDSKEKGIADLNIKSEFENMSDEEIKSLLADGEFDNYLESIGLNIDSLETLTDEEIQKIAEGYSDYIINKKDGGETLEDATYYKEFNNLLENNRKNAINNAVGLITPTTLRNVDFKITNVTNRGEFVPLIDEKVSEDGYTAENSCKSEKGKFIEITLEVTNNREDTISGILIQKITDKDLKQAFERAQIGFVCDIKNESLGSIKPKQTVTSKFTFDVNSNVNDLYLEIADAFNPFTVDIGNFAYINLELGL